MNHVSSQMCPINHFTSSNFTVLYETNAFLGIFSSAIPFAATWKNRHEGRAAVIYDMAITTISHITIHLYICTRSNLSAKTGLQSCNTSSSQSVEDDGWGNRQASGNVSLKRLSVQRTCCLN